MIALRLSRLQNTSGSMVGLKDVPVKMLPLRSSLPRFRISPIGIVIACLPVVLAMYWLLGSPDANFRSSDSNWARGEVSFKAYDFHGVANNFEIYRLKCNADSAQLVRTTKMLWWNVFAWPSYATNPKWNVPYGKPDQRIGSSYPRDINHCANGGLTDDEIGLVKQRAADLVQSFAGGT
jgi:hypothetical protein